MNRYYCPFCSSRDKLYKTDIDGVLICGLCGDPLVKKTYLNSRRIIGVITATAFSAYLIMMIIFVVRNFTNEKYKNNSESAVLLVTCK
tara:strand:+ start:730 stop:993 length:264 start_codon:yes stop_codon:yes gene_type:complete